VARQPEALAVLLYDDAVYHAYAVRKAGAGARATDTFSESQALGAPAATAPSLEALCDAMQSWGVYGPAVLDTILEYNEAVASGTANLLRVPRRANANPLLTPPFYALAVTPGITFTLAVCASMPMPRWAPASGCGTLCGGRCRRIHNERHWRAVPGAGVRALRAARGTIDERLRTQAFDI
jgi:hypothetical protein